VIETPEVERLAFDRQRDLRENLEFAADLGAEILRFEAPDGASGLEHVAPRGASRISSWVIR
jgi:K+-sensing histidine kinase KdpD